MLQAARARSPAIALAVVAPASPFAREEFDAGVAETRGGSGFEPVYDEAVFARQRYVAGAAGRRARRRFARAWQRSVDRRR